MKSILTLIVLVWSSIGFADDQRIGSTTNYRCSNDGGQITIDAAGVSWTDLTGTNTQVSCDITSRSDFELKFRCGANAENFVLLMNVVFKNMKIKGSGHLNSQPKSVFMDCVIALPPREG